MTKKILTLSFLCLLSVGLMTGYLYLTKKIITGSLKIAAGQVQIKSGSQMLAQGKARLASGEQELSEGKKVYQSVKSGPIIGLATIVPVTGVALTLVSESALGGKIAKGDQEVAQGRKKIKEGEARLKAGELELLRGIERLNQAKTIRMICLMGSIFFAFLFLVFAIYWRRSFFRGKSNRQMKGKCN